jgi:hypothetical protein
LPLYTVSSFAPVFFCDHEQHHIVFLAQVVKARANLQDNNSGGKKWGKFLSNGGSSFYHMEEKITNCSFAILSLYRTKYNTRRKFHQF